MLSIKFVRLCYSYEILLVWHHIFFSALNPSVSVTDLSIFQGDKLIHPLGTVYMYVL